MNIVIVGAGKVGELLCTSLSQENHNITLIEQSERRLEKLINMSDVTGIHGNGAILEHQMEAGVEQCDIFIAVTPNDETNIIAAITAKKVGARYTIARVRSPEYSMQMQFLRESLGINTMINPELEASRDIARMMRFPNAHHVDYFEHGRVNVIEVLLSPQSDLIGQSLIEIGQRFANILVCAVNREEDAFIPVGSTTLQAGDHLYLTGAEEEMQRFSTLAQAKQRERQIKNALIIGGGRLTRYLLPRLDKLGIRSKVIEVAELQARSLATLFPQCEVISGDGTSQAFLREERISQHDVVISLTGIDEENLLISIFAAKQNVPKTITKVNRTDLLKVLDNTGLQAIVTPRKIIANHIVRLVRSLANSDGSNLEAFYRIADDKAEILQFRISEDCKATEQTLAELTTKPGVIIACIIREGRFIYPRGHNRIKVGDEVILVTTSPNVHCIDDILS